MNFQHLFVPWAPFGSARSGAFPPKWKLRSSESVAVAQAGIRLKWGDRERWYRIAGIKSICAPRRRSERLLTWVPTHASRRNSATISGVHNRSGFASACSVASRFKWRSRRKTADLSLALDWLWSGRWSMVCGSWFTSFIY